MIKRLSAVRNLSLFTASLLAGVAIVSGFALVDSYNEIVGQTRRAAINLCLSVERDVSRDFHLVDQTLQGTIRTLTLPEFDHSAPELQQALLFNQTAKDEEFSSFFVLNNDGKAVYASKTINLADLSFGDRAYFARHLRSPSLDAALGLPLSVRPSGRPSITISRRIPSDDGSFAGVVVGAIHLAWFQRAFDRLDLGSGDSITLVQEDGTILVRRPELPSALTPALSEGTRSIYVQASRQRAGFGLAPGPDGITRLYAFRRVAGWPIFVVVGFSAREALMPWLYKLAGIGALTVLLSVVTLLLSRALKRELESRRAAERSLQEFNQRLEGRVEAEISAREEAQLRLIASRRLEALGQLAGGVAHDFNNVLQAISSSTRLLSRNAIEGESSGRLTRMITAAVDRGASVTQRLLTFARQSELSLAAVDLRSLMVEIKELLTHTLGGNVTVQIAVDPDITPIWVDKVQLETVLVNLATNARDAMAPAGGNIVFQVYPSRRQAAPMRDAGDGLFVCIAVTDTGCGMTSEMQTRALEPFFTTKPAGTGTGLGLPMATGFAEQSGGRLTIASRVGAGTTVVLWLPMRPATPGGSPPTWNRPSESLGRARILVVDDDMIIRELLVEELSQVGFEVRQASDGKMALELLDTDPDVLVTDLSMPGMDGVALIKEARRQRPSLSAILVTGYAGDPTSAARLGALDGDYRLMQKPLQLSQLVDQINITLNQAQDRLHATGA